MAHYDWSLYVQAYDPRGLYATSGWIWKEDGYPASGRAIGEDGFLFCPGDLPGTYTVRAELAFYDGPSADITVTGSPFTMRQPATRTRLRVNDTTAVPNQRLTFRIRSTLEYPTGYFPNRWENVVLQRRTAAGWKPLARTSTNGKGVAVVKIRWKPRTTVKVRAVTSGTADYTASASRIVAIR